LASRKCATTTDGDADCAVRSHACRIELNDRSRAANCKSRRLLCHLEICASSFPSFHGDLNFADDLVLLECSRHHVDKKFGCGYSPFAVWPERHNRRFKSENGGRVIRRGIRMCDAATNRAFVAHLNVADQTGGLGKRGKPAFDHIGTLNHMMRCQGADSDLPTLFLDVREFGNAADVDQQLGCGQPELHHWNQAMPAGKNFRVACVFLQEVDCVTQRGWDNILELLRDHDAFLPFKIFQTFSDRTGISMCVIPNGESASTMALTTAGVDPIVPASPTPLMPSGFTGEGVTVRSNSNS